MSEFITLSCPSCSGKLQITEDIDRFACAHCGNEHVVKRSGGVVSLKPVLEQVSKGVDSTASELAIVRLDKEISQFEKKLALAEQRVRELKDEKYNKKRNKTLIFGAAFLLVMCLVAMIFPEEVGCSLMLILVVLAMGYAYIKNQNKKSGKEVDMTEAQDDLQAARDKLAKLKIDRSYHHEKLDREG